MKKDSRTHKLAQRLRKTGLILSVFIIFVLLGNLLVQGYGGLTWTGFGEFFSPTGEYYRAKTLWDWLELLVIPIVLAGSAVLFNRSEKKIERELAAQRDETDKKLAADRMRESALQNYLDKMTDLLLRENLIQSTENSNVRAVARTRTLTVLQMLDGTRKGLVIKFLYEANLIKSETPIIDLTSCDLSKVQLEGALISGVCLKNVNLSDSTLTNVDLTNADLRGANLTHTESYAAIFCKADLRGTFWGGATLYGANLSGANLSEADFVTAIVGNMSGAEAHIAMPKTGVFADLKPADLARTDLQGADLTKCSLAEVNLQKADLSRANLSDANLAGADLSDATLNEAILENAYCAETNLTNAVVTPEQLASTNTLDDAILPSGVKQSMRKRAV